MPSRRNRSATRSDMYSPLAHVAISTSVPSPGDVAPADRDVGLRPALRADIRRQPSLVSRAVQITRVVEGDRLDEQAHRAVGLRCRGTGAQHGCGVGTRRRRGDDDAGQIAQPAEGVVVVEVPAETLLVAVPGDAYDQRVDVLTIGEERQRRSFPTQLVDGIVHVGEILDLRDRKHAGDADAKGQAEDRLLVEERVEDPFSSGHPLQPAGDAVDAALGADVLAEHEHRRIGGEQARRAFG